jgi:hypothetical protein
MPNDTSKAPYKMAHKARNDSKMVIEGVDEPSKTYASRVPEGYTSPDVEDHRSPEYRQKGLVQFLSNPVQ